ncbi:MAG: hypothetical protein NFCOHLIN_00508 [Gammaproteobacteria bacterium]|nr:hypothetical protein [Gammaproteobacteria bacterium]
MATARFRFYEELNDFLDCPRRKCEFEYRCAREATVKQAIEALGVPHTEVELILVNGVSADFAYRLRDGDRVSVYPMFEAFDVGPLLRLRPEPLRLSRFIADAQLGGLARLLRMLGFDTVHDQACSDRDVVDLAQRESRIILTRDRELLKIRAVTRGCYVHALEPMAQAKEVLDRLQLGAAARPFTLCLRCNLAVAPIEEELVIDRVPPAVACRHEEYHACGGCGRVYWKGSHWQHMCARLREILA